VKLIDQAVVGLLPLVPKPVVRRFAGRYIAGDDIGSAIRSVQDLNGRGMMATLDVLGEFITRTDEAEATCRAYEEALLAIERERLDSNISVKLTAMGLLLDAEYCFGLVRRLCASAAARGNFVRIDMEDSSCTTRTLDIYRRLRGEGVDNVGVVLQAYMRRSMKDIADLLPLRPSVRVCKGIYVEPKEVAFQEHDEVNANFKLMVETLLGNGCYVGIATHDEELVQAGQLTVKKLGLRLTAYEFQMLLGVREELRGSIVKAGHRLRVYVPYGAQWYAYSVRRLKENPRIAGYVFQNILKGFVPNGHGPESKR
jgi:proline dehydrogenase